MQTLATPTSLDMVAPSYFEADVWSISDTQLQPPATPTSLSQTTLQTLTPTSPHHPPSPPLTTTYTYRADGLRHSKTITSTNQPTNPINNPPTSITSIHTWINNHIILEQNNSNNPTNPIGQVLHRYNRTPSGELINSIAHGWYLFDARGSVIQRADNNTNILHTYHYTAFGIELNYDQHNTNRQNLNPFRFNSEYWDWESHTYYLRARHFNPRTGRFTRPDPFWNTSNMQGSTNAILQSGNLFTFAIHNPIMWADPSGLVIQLSGTTEEKRTMMEYLQQLTDHRLMMDSQGIVGIIYRYYFGGGLGSGNVLVERLIASEHVANIRIAPGRNNILYLPGDISTPGVGGGSWILFDPFSRHYTYTIDKRGVSSRTSFPAHIILAHELIHADRAMRGVIIPHDQMADITIERYRARFSPLQLYSQTRTATHRNVRLEEWATIGLDHFTPYCITENMIRLEHGLRARTSHRGH